MPDVYMVLGGSSSGKSGFAEKLAQELQEEYNCDVFYLATGVITDEEFAARVERHRLRRPQQWHTIEESRSLAGVIEKWHHHPAVLLVDCIGTWTANLMYSGEWDSQDWGMEREADCLREVEAFIRAWDGFSGAIILVADEVGQGIVPEYPQARAFRDLNGKINQMIAARASHVYLVTAGIVTRIKGGSH